MCFKIIWINLIVDPRIQRLHQKGGWGVEKKLATFRQGKIIVHIIKNKIPINCYTHQQSQGLV